MDNKINSDLLKPIIIPAVPNGAAQQGDMKTTIAELLGSDDTQCVYIVSYCMNLKTIESINVLKNRVSTRILLVPPLGTSRRVAELLKNH